MSVSIKVRDRFWEKRHADTRDVSTAYMGVLLGRKGGAFLGHISGSQGLE